MNISLIAAMSLQGVIGKDNQLPWHYPEDLKYFRAKTLGHTVVMGRNTFLSLGKPLSKRRNIVLTSNLISGVECYLNKEDFLAAYRWEGHPDDEEVFVIGGAATYQSFLADAKRIYLTLVKKEYQGDTYFPEFESDFDLISRDERGELDFLVYERKVF